MRKFYPYGVLALALVLPGMGQVAAGKPVRGLQFVFFILFLGFLSSKTAAPEASVLGRYAGGLFVHAVAAIDAYRLARLRWGK